MKRALKREEFFGMVVIKTPQKAKVISLKSAKESKEKKSGHYVKNPEMAVWKAVIMQAVLDLMSTSKRASEILAKKTAREWLNEKNANFVKVCGYAGLNPNWVLKKIEFAIENPRTWRRECDLKKFLAEKNEKKLDI